MNEQATGREAISTAGNDLCSRSNTDVLPPEALRSSSMEEWTQKAHGGRGHPIRFLVHGDEGMAIVRSYLFSGGGYIFKRRQPQSEFISCLLQRIFVGLVVLQLEHFLLQLS